jgi:hypothetical protein
MAVARLLLSVCVGVVALAMLLTPLPADAQVSIYHVRVTISGTSGSGAAVTAQYCDTGSSCPNGIQIWPGPFPVALAAGSSLVLTQTGTTTAPTGHLFGNFDTSDRIKPMLETECGLDGNCRVKIELDTTNTGLVTVFDDLGNGNELSMFNQDFNGAAQCEGHPFVTRVNGTGFTLATGYADNVHVGTSNALGSCNFLPTPFAASGTVTFMGAGVGKGLPNSPCTAGSCYDAGAILITGTLVSPAPPPPGNGGTRMTGGGSIFKADGTRVTHGFELHCTPQSNDNLEINWGGGNNFHLGTLLSASCTDDPTIQPQPPVAPFDTFVGTGIGTCNGLPALISFTLTDAGEPGTSDFASYTISGGCSLTASGLLDKGNQQAHK